VLPHIFEPFVTTKRPGEGTGLGLASSREIARQQGGWLECESEPGKGATLRFFLPRGAVPQGEKTAEPPRAATNGHRGTEKVLVVDDDPLVRNVSAKILGAAGYKVETACDGIEALDRLRQPDHPVEVVLLDLAMPRLSGVDTMREIRRIMPDLRVVLCSGSLSLASPDAFSQKYGLRPDATLAKPYDVADLSRAVRRAIDSSCLQAQNGTAC
jgi:two-component system cell cycle sensor histidine kinase/response regulator CckA